MNLRGEITEFIFNLYDQGKFSDYSTDHFLIKALNGDLDYFKKYTHLIKDNTYYSNSIDNATNFLFNFSPKFNYFYNHFTKKDMDDFIVNQLAAGKQNYSEDQFFRALSEINVLNFLMAFGPNLEKAEYEPPQGNNGANPEARLIYENNIIVDVEVKTPGFIKSFDISNIQNGVVLPTILMNTEERAYIKNICEENKFKLVLPRVLKLKEFINSAGKKFLVPKTKNHINLLYINWTYTDFIETGLMEPYSLLYNNLNGILKNKEYAKSIGIDEEALEKITAIIIYQDTFNSLIFGDFRYHWQYYSFRLLPNLVSGQNIDMSLLSEITKMNPPKNEDIMFFDGVFNTKAKKETEIVINAIKDILAKYKK